MSNHARTFEVVFKLNANITMEDLQKLHRAADFTGLSIEQFLAAKVEGFIKFELDNVIEYHEARDGEDAPK